MTYYAVTNDPNELMHFGILGMKWGVRRSPEQLGHPRHTGSGRRKHTSPAYKKAQAKLSKSMQNGIQRVEAKWREYNSPANKQLRAERRYENQTNRAIQKARKGKLKYAKLTDDQVYRITERLAMERNARQLSDTEKTFGKRLRQSIGEGIISGIGQGFGRKTSEWISRGSVLKTDRLRAEQQERMQRAAERRKERYDNRRSVLKRRAANEARKEYYEEAANRGELFGHPMINSKAKELDVWKKKNLAEEDKRKYANTLNTSIASNYGKQLAEKNFGNSGKNKKDKNKNKNKNKQQPISINIYGNGYTMTPEQEQQTGYRVPSKPGGYRKNGNRKKRPGVRAH